MKNITVSIDDDTHRLARVRAAELDTSVSALVRDYLRSLINGGTRPLDSLDDTYDAERERRRERIQSAVDRIAQCSPGFSAADNLPREELYDRNALR